MTRTDRLAELFDTHQRRLFHLALRLCSDREEARDLVQETFLRAARQSGAVAGEPWLVRTLVNLCKDRYRRLAVRSRAREEMTRDGQQDRSGPEEAHVARATVRAALARLAPRRRAVLVLHELEGRPVRDVARLLGVTEVTIRWHLLAARRELAKVLRAEGEMP
ncbi:MAG TPA: sigma-70 family RNA polymerase sigma factor [Thermoanaerobaculia bacterium]|nr:sigma-70 family RNA polymerase sigma factor [Thermoanaerobaculia bacterium]